MHKRSFFKNIGSIMVYAVFGTFLAALVTAIFFFLFSLFAFEDVSLIYYIIISRPIHLRKVLLSDPLSPQQTQVIFCFSKR